LISEFAFDSGTEGEELEELEEFEPEDRLFDPFELLATCLL
jgi:hypothetical protein